MDILSRYIYKSRFVLLLLVIVATLFLAFQIKIDIDNSLKADFSENDPDYMVYENFRDVFEGGSYFIAILESENIFTYEVLNYIREITEQLEYIDKVDRVHSLANANKIIGSADSIEVRPLLYQLGKDDLSIIRERTLDDEIFADYLISRDGRYTSVVVVFENMPARESDRLIQQIEHIVKKSSPDNIQLYFTGDGKAVSEFNRYTNQNLKTGTILIVLSISVCIFLLFRSFYEVLIILINIGISIVCTLGFYCILGFVFNVVTVMIIPIVTILSIADCIHIIKYYYETRRGRSNREAYIETIKYIAVPCFITSITTAMGLLSLFVSRVRPVRHFGIGAAAGVMLAFFISITVVPFLLTLLPIPKSVGGKKNWTSFLHCISSFSTKNYKYILIGSITVILLAMVGIARIRIESNQLEWFPKNSMFYRSTRVLDDHLFGMGSYEIIVNGEEDGLKNPDVLNKIDELSSDINKLPHVKKVVSVADYVKRINKALHENDITHYVIPDSRLLIAQELLLFSLSAAGRNELQSFVTPDYSKGRISVKTVAMPSEILVSQGKKIEEMAKSAFLEIDVQTSLTGTLYLYGLNHKYILESQIKSFSLAFVIILGSLFLAFRSLKYGMLCIFPNFIPIACILGIMGWFTITLNTATVMVASVSFGIVVDDTVHFLSRFRKEKNGKNVSTSRVLENTTVFAGEAMIFTTLVNVVGFLVLLISGFQPTREFGILVALSLSVALIGDLVILPANIMFMRRRFKL